MSGFRDRMGLARCCCVCTDCCNGDYPTEYDVDFTFVNNDCTNCADYSGTYTLSKLATCNWTYDSGLTLSDACDPPYGEQIKRLAILLQIRCVNATQYGITLYWDLYRNSPNCSGLFDVTSHLWTHRVNVADFSCSAAVDHEVPWGSTFTYGWQYNVVLNRCVTYSPTAFCDPPSNALITAVP